MSLNVNTYIRKDSSFQYVNVGYSEELFGFEICRHELWGHSIMLQLDLSLLPSLKETDIYAEDEISLSQLENEAHLILCRMAQVVAGTNFDEEYITLRLQNLLRAISLAKKVGGGVHIG